MAEQSPEKQTPPSSRKKSEADEFARHASTASTGIVREFWLFLRDNKKWWLTPIILVLLLVALLIVLGGTGAAPFIYTLF